jgi:hypothetical protein
MSLRCRRPSHTGLTYAGDVEVRWVEIAVVFGIVLALVLVAALAQMLFG